MIGYRGSLVGRYDPKKGPSVPEPRGKYYKLMVAPMVYLLFPIGEYRKELAWHTFVVLPHMRVR